MSQPPETSASSTPSYAYKASLVGSAHQFALEDDAESEKATIGGDALIEISELTVSATGPSAPSAVMMATPEG